MTNIAHMKIMILLGAALILTGCQSTRTKDPETLKQSLRQAIESATELENTASPGSLPSAVEQELLPSIDVDSANAQLLLGTERFDISANKIPAREFFASLVEDGQFSVAIHPQVSGEITLSLKQVSLDDVLNVVRNMYGYDIQREGRIYNIYPAGMRTETFAVNYLFMKRQGYSMTNISGGGVSQNSPNSGNNSSGGQFGNRNSQFSGGQFGGGNQFGNNQIGGGNGTNIISQSETDFWSELQTTLVALVGNNEGRSVVVSPQSGMVTVRAYPDEIRTIKKFLEQTEASLQRQVILEARILEVSLNDENQQGIKWENVLGHIGDTDFLFNTNGTIGSNSIVAGVGNTTSIAFTNTDFSGVVNLLSTQGNVHVLSSPRVTATNNQKSVIKVGDDEYFVTDVSSTTSTGSTTTTTTPDVELTPFFSGIALDVTPQIDEKGGVLLHVHPSVIETEEQEKVITINEEQLILPLAQSNIRESDTIIKANSGEIVVIGGLMQTTYSEADSKTPLLGDIPLVGNLFRSRSEIERKKELVILLKATVVGANTWRDELRRSSEVLNNWYSQGNN